MGDVLFTWLPYIKPDLFSGLGVLLLLIAIYPCILRLKTIADILVLRKICQ